MTSEDLSIAEMADILHQTASLYMASNIPIDYGTGEKYTPIEVHMLKYIIDHPGKNVTELSKDWDKTKAAVSQMMKKMENKGLIYWETAPDSNKKQLYYATEKGHTLNQLHIQYDEATFGNTLSLIDGACTKEELLTCFHVLEEWCTARRKKNYRFRERE